MDSILLTIKDMLGIQKDESGFDSELVVYINSAIMALNQLGVGPAAGFSITGPTEEWTSLFNGATNVEGAKQYIFQHVRMAFDPPSTSFVQSSIEGQLEEIGFRLLVEVDPEPVEEEA